MEAEATVAVDPGALLLEPPSKMALTVSPGSINSLSLSPHPIFISHILSLGRRAALHL